MPLLLTALLVLAVSEGSKPSLNDGYAVVFLLKILHIWNKFFCWCHVRNINKNLLIWSLSSFDSDSYSSVFWHNFLILVKVLSSVIDVQKSTELIIVEVFSVILEAFLPLIHNFINCYCISFPKSLFIFFNISLHKSCPYVSSSANNTEKESTHFARYSAQF